MQKGESGEMTDLRSSTKLWLVIWKDGLVGDEAVI